MVWLVVYLKKHRQLSPLRRLIINSVNSEPQLQTAWSWSSFAHIDKFKLLPGAGAAVLSLVTASAFSLNSCKNCRTVV